MTYIQPNRKSLLNKTIFALVGVVVATAFWLVILYNNIVDLEHGISSVREEIKSLQVESVDLNEKLFAIFDSSNFSKVLGANLIQDKNPEYMEVSSKWHFAS